MTTVAQVKQAVQPLLQRNPDLALVGRLIVIKPIRHILCGICVDRSLDPLKFVPTWSVILLSEPRKHFGYLWGARVRGPSGNWKITDPDLPATMCRAIEQEALVSMRSIKTFDDFISFASKEHFPVQHLDLYPATKMVVDIARGDLASAETNCRYLETDEGRAQYMPYLQEKYDRVMQELCPLVAANDRAGLAKLIAQLRGVISQKPEDREILGGDAVPDRSGILSIVRISGIRRLDNDYHLASFGRGLCDADGLSHKCRPWRAHPFDRHDLTARSATKRARRRGRHRAQLNEATAGGQRCLGISIRRLRTGKGSAPGVFFAARRSNEFPRPSEIST